MGIHYSQTNIHWNYYLAIESDFEKISRYIEFTEANNFTFSIELARIIMSGTQEVDGIMKKFCRLLKPESDPQNIKHYREIINEKLPEFFDEIIQIPRFGMTSTPWVNWKADIDNNSPDWWIANNKIKHNRTLNFEEANLKNAFNCVGALLITTLYFYKHEIENQSGNPIDWQDLTTLLKPKASLFISKDEYYLEPGHWNGIEW